MNVGIICDLEFNGHIGISTYYYAIKNIYGNIKLIKCVEDLEDINILFIGNEHFYPHRMIWEQERLQQYCNYNEIKVVVFSSERIYNSSFPHNEEIQTKLLKFKNLFQYTYDVDDLEILNTKLFRPCISENYKNISAGNYDKINKCVFLGSTNCSSYSNRLSTLKEIQKTIEIVTPERQPTWFDYMKEISKYKYVLSLLGNANGLNLRFYEILLINSIPIQQVKKNTLKYYDLESKFTDCIFFEDESEINNKILNLNMNYSNNNIFLENHIESLLKIDNLI